MLFSALVQVFLAWIYGHIAEYSIHRWLLHGFGKKRSSMFSYHFHDHHRIARTNAMYDPMYTSKQIKWDAKTKEIAGILFLITIHAPIAIAFPWFFGMLIFSAISYYMQHSKSHKNIEWARVALSWHYDHHMGPNQNKNFGVRSGLIDSIMGTRLPYYGTRVERIDHHRRILKYSKKKLRAAVRKREMIENNINDI